LKALDIIYKDGYKYLKCGVIVMDLVPDSQVQGDLFNSAKTYIELRKTTSRSDMPVVRQLYENKGIKK
jgi:hypothetical protein